MRGFDRGCRRCRWATWPMLTEMLPTSPRSALIFSVARDCSQVDRDRLMQCDEAKHRLMSVCSQHGNRRRRQRQANRCCDRQEPASRPAGFSTSPPSSTGALQRSSSSANGGGPDSSKSCQSVEPRSVTSAQHIRTFVRNHVVSHVTAVRRARRRLPVENLWRRLVA